MRDLRIAGVVLAWIGAVLELASVPAWDGHEVARQLLLGAATWLLLVLLLRAEPVLVRVQTLLVVALATSVEYTFSPLLHAYVYRIHTVPGFVPPGHGLVYLAALALSRSPLFRERARIAVAATVVFGGAWAAGGLLAPLVGGRADVLGAFWFACLLGFLVWGRDRLIYTGAFVVVSFLGLAGTALHVWTWAPTDPVLHVIGQGNPPSGAAGGYGWFDLWAVLLAPLLIRAWNAGPARVLGPALAWFTPAVFRPSSGPASGYATYVPDGAGYSADGAGYSRAVPATPPTGP